MTTNGVTSSITERLNHYQAMVRFIAEKNKEQILNLASGSPSASVHDSDRIANDVEALFTDVRLFAVIDGHGQPKFVSRGGSLGPKCLKQINRELSNFDFKHDIELHRYSNGPHFDVIVNLKRGEQYVALFVSFSLDYFQHLLSQFDSPELKLVLVQAEDFKTPILTSGDFDNIGKTAFSDDKLKNALAVQMIEHTHWLMMALPNDEVIAKHSRQIDYIGMGLFFAILFLLSAFLYYLKRVNSARFQAEQKASYSALFNAGPTVLFEKDFEAGMSIDYVSPNVLQLLGFTDSELMSERSFYDLIHPKDLQNFKYHMLQAIRNQEPSFELEYRLMCSDWHYIWVYSLIHINRNGRDRVQKVQGYITSIHAQKLAEQQATTLIENAPDAMVVTDGQGNIQSLNKMAESLFGYTKEELINQSMGRLIPTYMRAVEAQSVPQILPYRECVGENSDGRELALSLSMSRLQTADGVVIATAIRDVSIQKAAEEQMLLAKERAEALAQARSRFVAMISHEIRTPMNGVLGMADLLTDTPLNDTQKTYLEAIRESGRSLVTILNDVLDFSKLEQGGIQLYEEPFSLHDVVNNSIRLLTPLAKVGDVSLQQSFDHDCPEWAEGDPLRLRQILLNLVGNAIKFSPKGQVLLNVSSLKEDDEFHYIQFSVQDDGIGIAKEFHKTLFQPFIQVDDSTSRHFGGTGLGLAITKQLVDLMGGTIQVVSEVNQGSTFIVELPFKKTTEAAVKDHGKAEALPEVVISTQERLDTRRERAILPAALHDGKPFPAMSFEHKSQEGPHERKPLQRVLLVEDDPTNQKIAEAFINKLGLEVDSVNNGLEALEFWRLHHHEFGLILMDCQMPIMDGYEASHIIRQEEMQMHTENPTIIIAFTANAYDEDKQRCLDSGMDDLLVKPLFVEDFKNLLYKWFPELQQKEDGGK
ncbi:ATP-binding protein [Thiomicrorhabdus sp.]|uniref:hybrid sensor histidine kinase/response regulator n=1 Tax=Thiomicrorhabdus sp. TaxID=2039724 RepID=UPI00356A89DC